MADPAVKEPKTQRSWDRPESASFAQWMETRVARHSTRKYDWDALKFQADYDPKYRRAQMRYVGTGGTGVAKDVNVVAAEHFTFSTMLDPGRPHRPDAHPQRRRGDLLRDAREDEGHPARSATTTARSSAGSRRSASAT